MADLITARAAQPGHRSRFAANRHGQPMHPIGAGDRERNRLGPHSLPTQTSKINPSIRIKTMALTRPSLRCIALLAVLTALSAATARAADDQGPSLEKKLIAILQSEAPKAEKAIACKQLAIHGTAQSVPALAPLLADPQLASWARIALEAIPGPEADAALRQAIDFSQRRSSRRHDQFDRSPPRRRRRRCVDQPPERSGRRSRLGRRRRLGTHRQSRPRPKPSGNRWPPHRPASVPAVAEGCILAAERLLADGKASQAAALYDEVRRADLPKQKIIEATRGAILARKADGIPLLVEQLRSSDKGLVPDRLDHGPRTSGA